jgi:hypothetical protein
MSDNVITRSIGAIARQCLSEICSPSAYIVTCLTRSADGSEQFASLGKDAVEADVHRRCVTTTALTAACADERPTCGRSGCSPIRT